MSSGRIRIVALAAMLAACVNSKPHTYGEYGGLAPRVAPQKGERIPQHLTVQLGKPANVAVFLVIPGRGSQLLFPSDSAQNPYIEAGSHLVTTSASRNSLSDSSRLIRMPAQGGGRQQNRMGAGRDTTTGMLGVVGRGYLLMYASQEPLPYGILATKVSGLSLSIDDDDALNTVAKLIRSTTHTVGPWAAYATDFPP